MVKQEVNAEARGFIAGYVQVFFDEYIDEQQLVEGLNYWSIDLSDLEYCGFLNDLDKYDREKIVDAFKEVV